MTQEEIDAMLAGLSGEPAAASKSAAPAVSAAKPAPKPPAPAAPPAPLMVDQDELDRLMADLAGEGSEVEPAVAAAADAAPSGPLGQNDIDAILAGLAAPAAPPKPPAAAPKPPASGPLGQDDIDAMLAGLEAASSPAPAPAPAPAKPASNGPLGQDDIDAMLAGLETASAPAPAPAKPASNGPLGQDDIDAMMASLGVGTSAPADVTKAAAPAVAAAPSSANGDDPLGQNDIDALLRSMEAVPEAAPAAPAAAASGAMPAGKLGQDDIDSLLLNLGAQQISVGATEIDALKLAGTPGEVSKSGLSRGSLALTSEDLTALVSKHAAAPAVGTDAEGMIDQEDIDALVKQLGAVNAPAEAGAKPSMTEELAKHDAAIDELLGGQKHSANAVTMDAIDVRGLDRGTPGGHAGPLHSTAPTFNVPVLTPPELRGARWLLAAAVLLLSICAGTLVVVAGALRTLGGELAHERLAALEPGEDYGDDYKAAVARLTAPDEQEAAKGVLFLQRLKKRYPSHEAEVSLVLARHFRSLGAWREANREYASLPVESIDDDPRVSLEHADTFRQLHDFEAARRQLYNLLANEARHLAPTTPPRPADISERNRRTLIEGHLMLGRLLDTIDETALASAEDGHHAEDAGKSVSEAGHGAADSGHAAGHDAGGGHH
jgi:hypothetical protein